MPASYALCRGGAPPGAAAFLIHIRSVVPIHGSHPDFLLFIVRVRTLIHVRFKKIFKRK
jgi:hypothetical protein